MVGSVAFIGILLRMAGVESNPGPTDKFIYRYQYLLIEIGTAVMRNLFDCFVANDFMRYLQANPTQYNQLQFLMTKNIITVAQKRLLPPINNKPTSSDFDITLLACLLRNVCGLRAQTDLVWKSPVPGDLSVEADIARLRNCRNNLSHIGTVYISEQDLIAKWNDLSQILKRLNINGGITDLSKKIDDTEHMSIDVELEKRHREAISEWVKMDMNFERRVEEFASRLSELKDGQSKVKDDLSKLQDGQSKLQNRQSELHEGHSTLQDVQSKLQEGQSKLQDGQSKLQEGQSKLQEGQSKLQEGQSELKDCQTKLKLGHKNHMQKVDQKITEIEKSLQRHSSTKLENDINVRDHLIKLYQKSCCTLPVSALCCEDEIDLLSIYKTPTMFYEPYHRSQAKVERYSITSYQKIFCKSDNVFRNIYVTGDAGVGKTSLCKCMCNTWCKSQTGEKVKNDRVQKDIEFMKKFEFVFYISLRESDNLSVIHMIVDQLFFTTCKEKWVDIARVIENIIQQNKCLVIMDGLDEWAPNSSDQTTCVLPKNVYSDKCICLTTCRPFIIETIRLSLNDIDHQVHMTGIHGSSSNDYIEALVAHVNHVSGSHKMAGDFMREIEECGLGDQLNIPIIVSQLIVVWFERKLTDMSRAQIYSNIIEMLFERAEKRKLDIPIATHSTLQLPDSISELYHLGKHFPLLEDLCLLSFRSLFKLDHCMAMLVFTKQHLMKEPYHFSPGKIDFLCKIGILSRNKVIGQFGKKEHKLSFLHKSHMEFLAALFVSTFDRKSLFDDVVKSWNTLDNVLQYHNFLLLLAGMSYQKVACLFETIYVSLSDELNVCRRNGIFQHDAAHVRNTHTKQLKLLQNMVIHCFHEVGEADKKELKLEDYIFEEGTSDIEILKTLLLLNRKWVKSIYSVSGLHHDVFDQIKDLHCLRLGKVIPTEYSKFLLCLGRNHSTSHTICIDGTYTLLPELPMASSHHQKTLLLQCVKMSNNPQHLTSISLCNVTLGHQNLHLLVKYLSTNILMENIKLYAVSCGDHEDTDGRCTLILKLRKHTKLSSLCLYLVNILCEKVNSSSLLSLEMFPLSDRIVYCYADMLNSLIDSQLEHLCIYGSYWYRLDIGTITMLLSTVKTLACIKSLKLWSMIIPDSESLQLHPGAKQVAVKLYRVTFSDTCFHDFIESVARNKHETKEELDECTITLASRNTNRVLTYKETVDYMSEYLTPICNLHINIKDERLIEFETCSD